MDGLFKDLKDAPENAPVIPAGDYNAVVQGFQFDTVDTKDGERDVLRLVLTPQGNAGVMLSDKSAPVDGQTIEYTIFLPNEADKQTPAMFGRGSMYDISVRKMKKLFKACGVDPAQYSSLEEALEACKNASVVITIQNNQTEDGTLYDRCTRIV